MTKKKKIKMEHIERLSRGKRSGINIGSRAVGHNLRDYERDAYERSLKKGFLEIEERSRANLENIWAKVVEAKGWKSVTLIKSDDRISGTVFAGGVEIFNGPLSDAKKAAKKEAADNK